MLPGWKNQYCENDYTTKCSLQIQCNPCQITNGIFHRTRTKNFTVCIETQKTSNRQSNLEKEWSWRNQPSWPQTILQSYSHQDNMVLAPKQKHRPVEQERSPEISHAPMGTLVLTTESRIYNGEKTISSIRGTGKTGQLCVKQWN